MPAVTAPRPKQELACNAATVTVVADPNLCRGGIIADMLDFDEENARRLVAVYTTPDVVDQRRAIRATLATFPAICAGGAQAGALGKLSMRERFDWLVAPRSTIIQTSAVHSGRCSDVAATLARLLDTMVRAPK